jgi:hypothetical protein
LNKPFTSVAFLASGVILFVASGVTSDCAAAFFVSRVLSLMAAGILRTAALERDRRAV